MSQLDFSKKTVRGQQFWVKTRTSQRGVPYTVYQAIGPGNADAPKEWGLGDDCWQLTAKAAAEDLSGRLREAAFEAQQARELAGICEDCMQACGGACPRRQQAALSSRLRWV